MYSSCWFYTYVLEIVKFAKCRVARNNNDLKVIKS